MTSKRIALVTGANRGIGLEVARQLAARDLHVLLGARDPDRGRRAAGQLRLATLPGDGPSSGFFRDRKPVPW